ncbi:uncharacterized protein TM35_000301890 [Trypanosoma theileri]|uniref:Uncharacterized protein n=1 Tax=Trypanosoma theileri TaxID=67003 RepID=A0A1X0NPP5_9TRYP|nr:uncharacterized protein TM35_000301890 [Trypanosoma theileri]ORC86149.1 hypothetical protein TM35_000301890 [Trypanosoma theileri]
MPRSERLVVNGRAGTVESGRRIPAAPQRVWTEKQQQQQEKKVMPVNYNLLSMQESRPNTTSSACTVSTPNSKMALSSSYPTCNIGTQATSANSQMHDPNSPMLYSPTSSSSLLLLFQSQQQPPQDQQQLQQQLQLTTSTGGNSGALLEGPLPPEVREIIYSQCSGEAAEVAERHARRLLSTNRRVRVYREELQSAMEEVRDVATLVQRHHTVQQALRREVEELDAKIAQLLREKQYCELQQQEEDQVTQRMETKLRDANERVELLRSTIDNITKGSMAGYLLLQQLVPNLHLDNYIS